MEMRELGRNLTACEGQPRAYQTFPNSQPPNYRLQGELMAFPFFSSHLLFARRSLLPHFDSLIHAVTMICFARWAFEKNVFAGFI